MKQKKQTVQQKNAPGIAKIIHQIYELSKGSYVSSKEHPLSPLFQAQKINSDEQALVIKYFKDKLMWHEGVRAGMKYKWKAEFDDAERLSQDIINYYLEQYNNNIEIPKVVKTEIVDMQQREKKLSGIKPKAVGETGYVVYLDTINEAYVCKVTKYPNTPVVYEVMITFEEKNCILTGLKIHPTISLALSSLAEGINKFNFDAPVEIKQLEKPAVMMTITETNKASSNE